MRNLWLAAVILFLTLSAFAQTDDSKFDFYARAPYNAAVPRPQSILRYDVGTFHTTYAQMEDVIRQIARAAPDRVRIFDIGETSEHRMQHVVAISSPDNIRRLDEIKANIARLADPRKTSPSEAQSIIANSPIMCWMAYTIHGNESASFEAMLQVIYQLAASDEPATQDILKNSVALMVVGENPDGHERFVTWYNSVSVGDPNRAALEHREPWSVYGRLNHFRFDLNRDNLVGTQQEAQNMQRAYFDWNPQVSVDHHGQPSQFFFPPAALPINPNLPQPVTNKWLDVFGRANAAQFDSHNWDYYVRDIFDLFYPGYWDSMPSLNGATGMTYETDGGGFKGIRWTRDDGTIVTLRSAIAKHYIASLTTLAVAAQNREARLKDFYDFRRVAMEDAKNARMKRIVILPGKDPAKAADLVESLQRARIEVTAARGSFSSPSAHAYAQKDAGSANKTFPTGAYVIDLSQPQRTWAKSLLEPDTPQDAAFVREQIAKFKRNELRGKSALREDYGFYDITAWSLPLAFGLEAYWTEDTGAVSGDSVTPEYLKAQKTGSVSGRAQIAYIIPYESDAAGALAIRLQQDGFKVAVSTRALTAGGHDWKPGTFVVRISRNTDKIHEAIANYARDIGVNVVAVNSGFNETGDTGIGAENVVSLREPKIAMLADETVDQTSFGSVWWTLDRYGIRFTPLTVSSVKGGALQNYNVLILPDGSAGRYFGAFGAGGVSTLKEWINNGGNLICMRGSSVFAALKDVGLTSAKLVGGDDDDQKADAKDDEEDKSATGSSAKPVKKPTPEPTPTPVESDKSDKGEAPPVLPLIASPSANAGRVPEGIPGAIFRATVDRTAPITYGIDDDNIPVLLASGYFFRYTKEGINAVVFDSKPKSPLLISGFEWEGNTERLLKGTSYLIDEPTGGGHVVIFAEEPFFRGVFRTMTRPFFNAVLLN
jgi:Zinc carboxypeptidase